MPRNSRVGRGIVLGAVGMAAVLMTACTPPLPPDVLAAKAEASITCQSGIQPVRLAEEFSGAVEAVSASLSETCSEQAMGQATEDEAASVAILGHAPLAEELASFGADCPVDPIVVPTFAYAVVPAYNVIGLEGLVLTPSAIAGILNGTISAWDDQAIANENPDYDLSGLPEITVMSVAHPTGAVEAMTAWLALAAPGEWTKGETGVLLGSQQYPSFADLIVEMTMTEGSFAVLPALQAVNNGLPMAMLPAQGSVISPDDMQLVKVGSGATSVTTDEGGNIVASPAIGGVPTEGNFDAAAAKVVLAEGQRMVGWPVLGYAHAMVCDEPSDPLPLSTVQYLQRLAGQGSLETFGLTPLPEPIRVRTFIPLKVAGNLGASASQPASP